MGEPAGTSSVGRGASPDAGDALRIDGEVGTPIDPLRYGGYSLDPFESPGLIVGLVPQGARVLDVGCGEGTLAAMLAKERSASVVGLEPHRERAGAARERGVRVIDGELSDEVAGGLGVFDVVVFSDVLEHLVDPPAALRIARELLAPGGAVVASVPNVAHWTVRWNLARGRFEYEGVGIMDVTHLRWFTRASLLRLFDHAGFSVTDVSVSAGTWLPAYESRPWRWLGPDRSRRLVRWLARVRPTLFGTQHVVRAVAAATAPPSGKA